MIHGFNLTQKIAHEKRIDQFIKAEHQVIPNKCKTFIYSNIPFRAGKAEA